MWWVYSASLIEIGLADLPKSGDATLALIAQAVSKFKLFLTYLFISKFIFLNTLVEHSYEYSYNIQ